MRLACLAAFAALLTLGAAPAPVVTYDVSPVFAGEALQAVAVELRFEGDADGETVLVLPREWGGKPELWKAIEGLTVDGGEVRSQGPAVRIVTHRPGAALTVRYRVANAYEGDPDAKEGNAYRPVVRPSWFHLLGNAWVVEPSERWQAKAQVRWVGWPKTWTLASDLDHQHQGVDLTVGGVIESVSLGGPGVKVISRPIRGGTLRFAVQGDWAFGAEEFADHVAKVISAQRAFFDDVEGPFFVSLIQVSAPRGWRSIGGTGRSDGFALFSTAGDVEGELRGILGHEHVHSWLPGRLTRMPSPEQPDYWFSEGFTDFYAFRTQLVAGVWSLEDYVAALNDAFREHDGSSARHWTNERVAQAFWSDPAAQRIPYRRGLFLALHWDERLRTASGGKADLDDVILAMRDQAQGMGDWSKVPPPRVGLTAAMKARGVDPTADIARHVEAGEDLALPAAMYGGCLRIDRETLPVFERGWDTAKTSANGVVTGLNPRSPAYAAGLRDGMTILKREAGAIGDSRVEYALRVKDGQTERVIRFMPQGEARYVLRTASLAPGLDGAAREACRRRIAGEI